jgi:iron complex outermembrane receptor protein
MTTKSRLGLLCTVLIALLSAPATWAQATSKFDLPSQSLAVSLRAVGSQASVNVLFDPPLVEGLQAPALKAQLTADQAFARLLAGSKLKYRFLDSKTVVVISASEKTQDIADVRPIADTTAPLTAGHDVRLAQSDPSSPRAPGERQDEGAENPKIPKSRSSVSEETEGKLQEIIVTVSKRTERVQDVPASITALGGEELRQRGAVSMEDYLRSVPGLSYIDRGVANNSIVIRGLTADAQNYTDMGGTVGIYLGDIPLAGLAVSGNNADIKLIDMERVEVVRGPQGTLYGDGALGGAVRNIPAAPNLAHFGGTVQVGYSETGQEGGANREIQGVMNFPIVANQLALRAVGYRYSNSGYIKNSAASNTAFANNARALGFGALVKDQDDIGNSLYEGGRVTALWQPTEKFRASTMFLSQNLEQNGLPEVQLGLGTYEQTRLQISEAYRGGGERLRDKISIANLELEYDLGWSRLFSSTSYIEETGLLVRDIGTNFGNIPTPQSVDLTSRATIEEVRLTSQLSGPFQFLTGFYYNDTTKRRYSDAFKLTTPPTTVDHRFRVASATQRALFGEASYAITEHFKATLGARAFNYDQEFVTTSLITPVPTVRTLENKNNSGETYKLNATYQPSRDALFYTQWAQGFRLGSPIAGPPASVCDIHNTGLIDGTTLSSRDRHLDPDRLDSYEAGTKLTLLHRRLTVNAAVYRNDWSGIPVVVLVPCGFGQFVNAGKAKTQGVEVEGTLHVLDALSVTLGASYVDAELTKDAPGVGLKGNRLPGSPRYNVNSAVQYGFALGDVPAFVRADYLRTGGFYNNLASTGTEIANYGLLNLRSGVTFGPAAFELFVNNVTNEDALTWLDSVFARFDARASRLRPRTVGMTVRYQF